MEKWQPIIEIMIMTVLPLISGMLADFFIGRNPNWKFNSLLELVMVTLPKAIWNSFKKKP